MIEIKIFNSENQKGKLMKLSDEFLDDIKDKNIKSLLGKEILETIKKIRNENNQKSSNESE